MSKVTYDGEDVKFEGAPPKNLGHLIEILRAAAANDKRILVAINVDGRDALSAGVDLAATSYAQVDVKSGTTNELFLKAIDATLSHLPEADATIDGIVESLLSDSWATAFTRLNAFLQQMGNLFELLSNISNYSKATPVPWKNELEALLKRVEETLTKVLRSSETQQVAELSGLLNFELRPLYVDTLALIKGSIRQTFAK